MSTGLNCLFVEPAPGRWYYVLEHWSAPKSAWDWREWAHAYGPFSSEEAAHEHLRRNHANPGGSTIVPHSDYKPDGGADSAVQGGALLMKICEASFITRHFGFVAYGQTADAARDALIQGLRFHARQYDLDPDWWMEGFEGAPIDEIFEVREFETGVAYRDRQALRPQ